MSKTDCIYADQMRDGSREFYDGMNTRPSTSPKHNSSTLFPRSTPPSTPPSTPLSQSLATQNTSPPSVLTGNLLPVSPKSA